MTEDSQHNGMMQYSFLKIFANDRTIDIDELHFLERLALKDHRVDDKEKDVLRAIFGRVTAEIVTPEVWLEMESFREKHGF